MLSRTFERRHPLHAKQTLRQRRDLSRRSDGSYVTTITDENVPADAPHYKRIEYQETMVTDVRGARAFARATYDEWLREIDDAEDKHDVGAATTSQAA